MLHRCPGAYGLLSGHFLQVYGPGTKGGGEAFGLRYVNSSSMRPFRVGGRRCVSVGVPLYLYKCHIPRTELHLMDSRGLRAYINDRPTVEMILEMILELIPE